MRKFLIYFLFISLTFLNLIYASDTNLELDNKSTPTNAESSELLFLKGIVKSDGKHSGGTLCKATLEFVDDETGKSFELEEAKSLEALHCEKEKDFVVKIIAEKEAQFLFWGGDLKLKSFEILEERDPKPHIRSTTTSFRHRTNRFLAP